MKLKVTLLMLLSLGAIGVVSMAQIGVGAKFAVYPFVFEVGEAFVSVRTDFLVVEGGMRFDLNTLILNAKLFLADLPFRPFTGGGLALTLSPLSIGFQGLGGIEYPLPPLILLGELQARSPGGFFILLGIKVEF
jgi:hypothetical protein